MDIVYRQGDLLEAPERVICHGCNAQGKMGAGIAVPIKQRYPMAFQHYRDLYEAQGNRLALGQCLFVACPDGRTVIDAVTQDTYGREAGVVYARYDAIRAAMMQINLWTGQHGVDTVAFPKIGAGLANGDWDVIAAIITAESSGFQPIVYSL